MKRLSYIGQHLTLSKVEFDIFLPVYCFRLTLYWGVSPGWLRMEGLLCTTVWCSWSLGAAWSRSVHKYSSWWLSTYRTFQHKGQWCVDTVLIANCSLNTPFPPNPPPFQPWLNLRLAWLVVSGQLESTVFNSSLALCLAVTGTVSGTLALCHSVILLLLHTGTLAPCHFGHMALWHSDMVLFCHFVTLGLWQYGTLSLCVNLAL